ncbi:MAG: glutaredoxin [Eubacterium sp.]|nr:glutaredoxin [Eubacterium sp.]
MKKLTFIYLNGCPYCAKAQKAFDTLLDSNEEYKKIEIDAVEENSNPEKIANLDYYHVPTYYVEDKKVFEASPGDSYEVIEAATKKALDIALSEI